MGEPLQSHHNVVYIAFTFRVLPFHTWMSLSPFSSSQVLQPYYVLVDALFFMTGCGAIQTLNNSYDPIEELQPERLVYTLRLHFRVVDFQVEWHFVPIETPTLSTTHLNACCVASRLIVTCLNSITTSATISAKSSSSSSILPCRPFTLGSPNMSQKSACTCRIWGGTTGVLDQRETMEGSSSFIGIGCTGRDTKQRSSFTGIGCTGRDTKQSVSGQVLEATSREREREREGGRERVCVMI